MILNLGDDLNMGTSWSKNFPDVFNIGGFSNERGSNEIDTLFDTELDIVLISLGEGWQVNDGTWQVHVLLLSKFA